MHTLIGNIGKTVYGLKVKIFVVLLGLPFAMMANTEEVLATVMSGTYLETSGRGVRANYNLATTGSILANKLMTSFLRDKSGKTVIYNKLFDLLKDGTKIIFEDKGLQSPILERDRLIAIIMPDETRIELTQLFSFDEIKREFPYLWEKLVREGRAK
jgi:hypothetical protein